MKIIVTDYIENDLQWENEELSKMGHKFEAFQLKKSSPKSIINKIKDADILIVNMVQINKNIITHLNNCKLIVRHGAGYDNIDLKAASEKNITVSYIPDYCTSEVAEQALMLLLGTYRKFVRQLKSMELSYSKNEWDFSPVALIKRFSGKKAGLIGCGRIGQKVLNVLRAFNIEVLVDDPLLSEKRKKILNIKTVSLKEVLENSDMVSIHCSLNKDTYHLIGERELKLMKPESVLVNTARGAIIDAKALAKACREGWIAGAGIDVYEEEPPKKNHPLAGLDNVILTPHLSWYSEDAGWDIRKKIMEDIKRFSRGEKPRFPVN